MSEGFLSLLYSPSRKYLLADWLRPVSSEEYRQGIRFIALSIAKLRVQYTVIDLSKVGVPSEEDQHCTSVFLKQALHNTSLCRSARVLSGDARQWSAYARVVEDTEALPYKTNVFGTVEKAQAWVLEDKPNADAVPEDFMSVPMSSKPKALRALLQALPPLEVIDSSPAVKTEAVQDVAGHEVLRLTGFLQLSKEKQSSLLTLRWLRPVQSREYRYGVLLAGRALMAHKLERLLVDNRRLGIPSLEDQAWLTNVSIEILAKSRLTRMAIIPSFDWLQQMATEAVGCKIKGAVPTYLSSYFLTESEALEWLQETMAHAQ
ncbi:hypothetical protein [Pontibacter litorisediminis]|uniref:hypothetical protein n=1 Tax=Pontibacter litorisediminis TaxID=1846260 RepID=UPI0023EC4AD4|nr:hypothetical protein [Pontibacter litorisediminis]